VTDSPRAAPAHLRTQHLQTATADASGNSPEASTGAQLTRGVIRSCGGLRLARGGRTSCQRHGSSSVHDLQGCGPCLGGPMTWVSLSIDRPQSWFRGCSARSRRQRSGCKAVVCGAGLSIRWLDGDLCWGSLGNTLAHDSCDPYDYRCISISGIYLYPSDLPSSRGLWGELTEDLKTHSIDIECFRVQDPCATLR
jgi:hypothetical protein